MDTRLSTLAHCNDAESSHARAETPRSAALAAELRHRIASGDLAAGDRLPAVRVLAAQRGVHPRVVSAAYAELRDEGVLEGRAGAGTRVSPPSSRATGQRVARLSALAADLLDRALADGYAPEEVSAAVANAAGRWREDRREAEGRRSARPRTLRLAGSHDLALELLAAQLGAGRHPVRLIPRFDGSLPGLLDLAAGSADVAGVHLLDHVSGEYNLPFVRRLLPGRAARLVLLAERDQGLMVPPGNPLRLAVITDLCRPGVRLANRQEGSGTRALLDALLFRAGCSPRSVEGYDHVLPTHLAVANAVALGSADVGLGIAAAAGALGLEFLPVAREPYELVFAETTPAPLIERVRRVLSSEPFRSAVAALGGYDPARSGEERRAP
jgi:molybdate-binding protein/DNA-binding transcriptional regulator YhcF (GntR family)